MRRNSLTLVSGETKLLSQAEVLMGNLLNRFGPSAYENLHDTFTEKPRTFQKVRRIVNDETEKSAAAPEVTAKPTVDELRERVADIPARKMGRPSKGKPWVEAGVSKASWYRQQKSKGGE